MWARMYCSEKSFEPICPVSPGEFVAAAGGGAGAGRAARTGGEGQDAEGRDGGQREKRTTLHCVS